MENTEIVFEEVTIKPNKWGIYRCPFGCHKDNRFPEPTWKTKKGFLKHLEKCYMRPSAVEERLIGNKLKETEQNKRNRILDSLKEGFLNNFEYKIGDEISYIKKVVVKDTHEWRGSRMVKMRYEPILRFEAIKTTISSINFEEPTITPTMENISNLVYFNNGIKINTLMNYEEALVLAKEKTKADEEYRHECSLYR